MDADKAAMDENAERKPEAWQSPAAVQSRSRLGWGIAVFVVALVVLPMVAKYFHWF
ncbi:MAG TPA: hypothetical protein VL860_15635 [Planctomycetota bacterium]|nr:hypothetical protein [Planctomycetota bacterium]